MKRLAFATIVAAMLALGAPATAAPTTFHLDAATVTKSGAGAKSLILIPGLGCGPFVFDGVASELAQRYTVYTIWFDGFDGKRGASAPYLAGYTKSVADLIEHEHLVKPTLIGHSLGGHIAVALAETMPASIGAVVAIDAVPLFPPRQPGETQAAREAFAKSFVTQIAAESDAQFQAYARQSLANLVTGDKNTDLVYAHTFASNRQAFAGAAADMMLDDLGPALGSITAPVLVLAPAPDLAFGEGTARTYRTYYDGTPHLTVQAIAPARHFLMLDQPAQFRAALDAFVDANAK